MPLTHEASGTFAIAPTPFHEDGRIDEASIDRLTDFYRDAGCNGITVLGIMGEAPKLDGQEAVGRRDALHPPCAKRCRSSSASRRRALRRCARSRAA